MRIDPVHLDAFRTWMRTNHPELFVNPNLSAFTIPTALKMMKPEQWRILADIADRAESSILGEISFDQNALLELDETEQPYYEEFLRSITR